MAISKIILNGVTQMDLTTDTVAQASHIVSPYVGHLNDGTVATGTASVGNDFIITLTYNSTTELWEPNKTFVEIQTAYNNNDNIIVNGLDADDEVIQTSFGYSTTNTLFWYDVAWNNYDNNSFCHDYYTFDANNGLILGYRNSYTTPPNLQSKTNISPTTSSQTITADSGYDGLSSVQINAMPTGTAGTPSASKGTVSNHSISVTPSVTNTTGYITGGTKTGTAVTVSASELVSGTLSITSSGTKDVTNYASASVSAGTEGTPSATKGTVSNHQVTVTPSVTNTTGYITGGTKTGTAVTVTASELASGNKAIVDNGTNIDVVGYSTVSVAVPFSTVTVSSSNPTGGSNGDIWIKTS